MKLVYSTVLVKYLGNHNAYKKGLRIHLASNLIFFFLLKVLFFVRHSVTELKVKNRKRNSPPFSPEAAGLGVGLCLCSNFSQHVLEEKNSPPPMSFTTPFWLFIHCWTKQFFCVTSLCKF